MCLEPYNQSDRRPRALPCGHSFCSKCIRDIFRLGSLTCPNCRAKHAASDASKFPFAYELEEMLALIMQKSLSLSPATDKRCDAVWEVKEEQKRSLLNSIADCEEMLAQLHSYDLSLDESLAKHQDLMDSLRDIVDQHKRTQTRLENDKEMVSYLEQQGQDRKQQLNSALDTLAVASTGQETERAVGEGDRSSEEAREWIGECQQLCPDVETALASTKVGGHLIRKMAAVTYL